MVHVKRPNLGHEMKSLFPMAYTVITKGKHILTMYQILPIERIIPDEQIGQRHSKIVHGLMLEDVLFAVVDELVEATVGLVLAT